MSITLRSWQVSDRVGEVEFEKVYLQPAVDGCALRFVGRIENGSLPVGSVDLVDLTAAIFLDEGPQRFLCEAKPDIGIGSVMHSGDGKAQIHLQGIVSFEALEAIEASRQSGDLKLKIGLRGVLRVEEGVLKSIPGVQAKDIRPGIHVVNSGGPMPVTFPRSLWEDTLVSSGYGRLVHFALSLPKGLAQPVQEAYRQLGEAQKLLAQGNFRQVIAECRAALNKLRDMETTGSKDKELFRRAFEKPEDLTEPERVALVRAAVLSLAQTGIHPEQVPETTVPTYATATAVLYIAGLTAWLEDEQREIRART